MAWGLRYRNLPGPTANGRPPVTFAPDVARRAIVPLDAGDQSDRLMAGYLVDPKSAQSVLEILSDILQVKVDFSDLESRAERVLTPVDGAHRAVAMAIERGKLQELVFDNRLTLTDFEFLGEASTGGTIELMGNPSALVLQLLAQRQALLGQGQIGGRAHRWLLSSATSAASSSRVAAKPRSPSADSAWKRRHASAVPSA